MNNYYQENPQANSFTASHAQLTGMADYDAEGIFLFLPSDPVAEYLPRFRAAGVAQQMSDGTFHFVRQPRLRAQSLLIHKLPHGRLSLTKDGAIQLTLKVYLCEGINISQTIANEARIATKAIGDWQRKR